ncbi:DNA-binding transcriptional LysR family regulator [Sphingomonas vulcanisoli]|uniref:DNA-binding transcriptional LysR family regulator n=1 Tax=Sphingomonas vulcanisoli TaxID=1658060 RepID=A0ABX0TUL6_9SPHN|nr:LysR family transcriptional regulator [Sphingomonas vulcanisoli]NIJ09208.1 DNA-binding transcriptional LysR family regulator [Sphingomonas vulcanisoli]
MITPFALNLRHLRALAAIVAHRNVSAAAEAVSLSQPALTQGLAKLERQLGIPLFLRRTDGVHATPAGLVMAERATAALDHLAKAVRAMGRGGARGFARADLLMTGTQLHAFLSLADAGSFAAASARTGITQPALHRAVRDLEQLCGIALDERTGRGLTITAAGRRLARGIRLAAAEIAAAISEVSPDPGVGTRIAIGAMPLSRALLLPAAIAALMRNEPRVTIDVREGSWRELVEPLRDGAIDLMVGALRDPPPSGLVQEPLFVDRLIVVGRAGHPLLGGPPPTLDDYRRYGWVIGQPDTPLRRHWQRLFEGGPTPAAPLECGSVMVIRGVLGQSDLLTLLSADQVAVEIANGMLALIGALPVHGERTIGLTTREGWRPTAVQTRFLGLLRAAVEDRRLQEIE